MKKLVFLAILPVAALAVEDKEVAACAAVKNDVTRLSCFDQMASKNGLVETTVATVAAGSGKWSTSTSSDPLTDKSVYLAFLDADQGRGKYGGKVDLVVRCKNNSTELYINWNSYLGLDTTTVTHRVDKNKAITSSWDVSTDHKSTFMRAPVATLKQMLAGESFIANVTPYGESPVTAVFDIKGAEVALQDIRKGCGW